MRLARVLPWVLLTLLACLLLAGLVLPIMRLEQLYLFTLEPSIIDLIAGLWDDGDRGLALLVAVLSAIFPGIKLVTYGFDLAWQGRQPERLRRLMPHLAKWSMMDVMLVAIVVFAAKTSGLAHAVTLPGFWCYAGSALGAALFPSLLGRTAPNRNP